ncbi:hypothetical protein pipiens_012927 [Culex pipiens pipiens]|uniref:C2H2-type domain-containing protein n=1 Tax=Culex pipiens pipiens TaxID=38569 RepID=A0ABD1D0Q9_CULPP
MNDEAAMDTSFSKLSKSVRKDAHPRECLLTFRGSVPNQPRRGSTTSSLPAQLQEKCQMCFEAAAGHIRSEDASNHIRSREHIFKLSLSASGATATRICCWEQKRSVLQGVFFEIEFRLIDGKDQTQKC